MVVSILKGKGLKSFLYGRSLPIASAQRQAGVAKSR